MLKKQPVPSTDDLRDSSILGSRTAHPLDDIPLCKGSNRICQFISCSAENFKKDPTFGNLQLAAQAIVAVCKEQGMDDGQCKLFSNGFQLIDKINEIAAVKKRNECFVLRFITTIESKTPTKIDEPQRPVIPDPPRRKENDILMDDAEYTAEPVERPKALGSKTWSRPQLFEVRNDLVASFTPLPPAPFVPPTPPAAPPLAFPTVPSLIIPPFTPAALSFEKLLEMKKELRTLHHHPHRLPPSLRLHHQPITMAALRIRHQPEKSKAHRYKIVYIF
ncbi:unnamed protein product [Nippostrongylus brasiliensis]|uniref:Ground-like domain-containing protein n=1 Tax=Nippostrongylus brasiliensis TaxID=27835 RepID=A0A158R1J4_NIPBR|nr:unnamed protein product [Nippostrongylus brasiliensis]